MIGGPGMKRMRSLFLNLSLVTLLTLPLSAGPARPSLPQPPWLESYSEALDLARKQNQLIIVDLYTDWCMWCAVMDRTTFANPSVLEQMGSRYVWLRLNTEKQADGRAAQRRFRVSSYPTTLLVEPREQLFERAEGYLPPEEFLRKIRSLNQELNTVLELREQVESYPDKAQLRVKLARRYMQRGRFELATNHYEILVKQDSLAQLDECYFYQSLCLASDGKKLRALERLGELKERFPRSSFVADAMALQGEIHLKLDENKKASRLWKEYLHRFPGHPMAPYIRDQLRSIN